MTEVSDRYAAIASGFADRLHGVAPDAWTNASPCTDWDARQVAVHVIDTHRRVMTTVDGGEPEPAGPAGDLGAQWQGATDAVQAALVDPERGGKVISGMFGEQPFESLVGRLLCADTLVHTWDLARATGQDERLDADGVARATEFLASIDDKIRRPGGFAPKIEPAADADAQTRFLNFCGRSG